MRDVRRDAPPVRIPNFISDIKVIVALLPRSQLSPIESNWQDLSGRFES